MREGEMVWEATVRERETEKKMCNEEQKQHHLLANCTPFPALSINAAVFFGLITVKHG